MILYVANGTRDGGEIQLTRAQLSALIEATVGSRNVQIAQKLISAQGKSYGTRPLRLACTTSEIATLREVAAGIPDPEEA